MAAIATDPPVSERQRRAMEAAAHGRSALGIPKKVGQEFVGKDADEAPFHESDHPRAPNGEFGSGGGATGGAAATDPKDREAKHSAVKVKAKQFFGGRGAKEVFASVVDQAATKVRDPHNVKMALGYAVTFTMYHLLQLDMPANVEEAVQDQVHHFAGNAGVTIGHAKALMRGAVNELIRLRESQAKTKMGGDAGPNDEDEQDEILDALKRLRDLLGEEDDGEEDDAGAEDSALAFDRAAEGIATMATPRAGLAFDRESVRTYDADGRLHVAVTNISKANVCPYIGREIPDWEKLGLDPDKVYKLFRDPEELTKAAPTFNNKQLLSRHVAVSADDHQPDLVIGATGSDAEFAAPYLRNSLVVWAKPAIDDIESEAKKELSSAYRYRADMTPGQFEGESYDGVMRDIVGNHVALVKEGRAGTDVVVGDSTETLTMATKPVVLTRKAAVAQGALMVFLKPKLAKDAKIDLTPILAGVTAKNFAERKPAIATALKAQTKAILAKDADIDDVVDLLDSLEKIDAPEVIEEAVDPNAATPRRDDDAMDDDPLKNFLKGKLSGDDYGEACKLMAKPKGANDAEETEEEKKKREAEEKAKAAKDAEPKDMVTKNAMDSAIETAVKVATDAATKRQRDIREAERAVRPHVGELAVAFDSADEVYRTTLTSLGIKIDGVHPSAYPALLAMVPVPGATKKQAPVAMDAAGVKGFHDRFPNAARIGQQ